MLRDLARFENIYRTLTGFCQQELFGGRRRVCFFLFRGGCAFGGAVFVFARIAVAAGEQVEEVEIDGRHQYPHGRPAAVAEVVEALYLSDKEDAEDNAAADQHDAGWRVEVLCDVPEVEPKNHGAGHSRYAETAAREATFRAEKKCEQFFDQGRTVPV